jgi:hypothetical protein
MLKLKIYLVNKARCINVVTGCQRDISSSVKKAGSSIVMDKAKSEKFEF